MYEYFEHLLQKYNVSVSDVSKATGIGQSTLSNWKARRNILGADLLMKIAKYFNVQIEYFLGGDLIEWNPETQEIIQTEDYYVNEEAKEMAQFLFSNPEYKVLFDASRKVKPEDLKKAVKALGIFTED